MKKKILVTLFLLIGILVFFSNVKSISAQTATVSLSMDKSSYCIGDIPYYTVFVRPSIAQGDNIRWSSTLNGSSTGENQSGYNQILDSSSSWFGPGHVWATSDAVGINDIGNWTKWVGIYDNNNQVFASTTIYFSVGSCVTLSVNNGGVFNLGGNWTLTTTSHLTNTSVGLCATDPKGNHSCSPQGTNTNAGGGWTASGTYPIDSNILGTWSEYVSVGCTNYAYPCNGANSNSVSITINPVTTYTVTGQVSGGVGGTVSPSSQTVNSGSTTILTVFPNSGYNTSSASGCGGSLSGNTYYTGAITANCTVTASFTASTTLPNVTTSSISNIGQTTATGGGTINSNGGATVTQSGIVWSNTTTSPTTSNYSGINTYGYATGGPWTDNIIGLNANTTYYVRAYATNSVGTAYGNYVSFTTTATPPVMSGTLLPLNPTCTITEGGNSCTQLLTWTTTNPVATSAVTSPTGTPSPGTSANNSSQTFTVPYNASGVNFFLYNNGGSPLAQTNVTTSCDSGTGWNGSSCAAVTAGPTVTGATINPKPVNPDGASQYSITVTATDGNNGSAIASQYAMVNYQGTNAGTYRGYVGWSTHNFPYATQIGPAISCAGGGQALKLDNFGTPYINLISCSTSVSGNTRTTTFVVSFNSSFTTPTANNTISTWAADSTDYLNSGWGAYDTFSLACANGATNSPSCTINSSGNCLNGANNPPTCTAFSVPTVTTATPINITQTTATGNGNVTSNGGATVTSAGMVWSTSSSNLTLATAMGHTADNNWADYSAWADNITGLTTNTTYYVRAYATNSVGTAYGADVQFTTAAPAPVLGVCGTANGKTYPYPTSSYGSDTQCSVGTTTNGGAFPAAGGTANWQCTGLNGGGLSGICSASQAAAPAGGSCAFTHYNCITGTSSGTTGDTATLYKWDCNAPGGNVSCSESKLKKPIFIEK